MERYRTACTYIVNGGLPFGMVMQPANGYKCLRVRNCIIIILYYVTLYNIMSCYIILCYAILCYVMLYYIMLSYIILYYIMLYYIMNTVCLLHVSANFVAILTEVNNKGYITETI
jgi:hypothetical protein